MKKCVPPPGLKKRNTGSSPGAGGDTSVKVTDQVYNAVRLPDDFATFTLEDMTRQVLRPQAESVVDALATPLITEMSAIATDASIPAVAPDGGSLQARSFYTGTSRAVAHEKGPGFRRGLRSIFLERSS